MLGHDGRVAAAVILLAAVCLVASCGRKASHRSPPDTPAPAAPQPADVSRPTTAPPAGPDATKGQEAPPRNAECAPGPLPADVPPVPDGVLFQSLNITPRGEAGFRVYADGRVESRPIGAEWTFGPPLPPERLAAVRRALAEADLGDLAPAHRVSPPSDDVGRNWLQIRDGATTRDILFDDPCFVPAVHAVMVELAELFD